MTGPQNEPQRDWDGEFERITRSLGDLGAGSATGRSAARETVVHVSDSVPQVRTPRTEHAPDGSDRGEMAATPDQDHPGVPGFKSQWRLGPPAQPAAEERRLQEARFGDRGSEGIDEADDDAFDPPELAPIGLDDPATVIMIACLVLGPLWLLYLVVFDRQAAGLTWCIAAAVLLAGFALAVARQPRTRDDDPDDDGARV